MYISIFFPFIANSTKIADVNSILKNIWKGGIY